MLTIVLCVLVVVLVADGLSYWLMWRALTREINANTADFLAKIKKSEEDMVASQGVLLGLIKQCSGSIQSFTVSASIRIEALEKTSVNGAGVETIVDGLRIETRDGFKKLRASLESDIDTIAKDLEAQKADNDKLKTAIAELQGHAMQPAPVDDTPADPGSQWGRAKGRLQRAKKVVVEGETL